MTQLPRANWRGRHTRIVFVAISTFFCLLSDVWRSSVNKAFSSSSSASPRIIPIHENLRKQAGILTTRSLCRITLWAYTIENEEGTSLKARECYPSPHNSCMQLVNATQLAEGDTIFVPFTALSRFVYEMLDSVTVNVAVFSGQTWLVRAASESVIEKLINHPRVIMWFCQNLPLYGGVNPHHPKVSPFPYGMIDNERYSPGIYGFYKQIFFESLRQNSSIAEKEESIFAGPLSLTKSSRSTIPHQNERLHPLHFFKRMAKARYVISPNGDRPECYRHYEAIGLGTMPITELDPVLFRHFGSNVIFNNSDWNLTVLEGKLYPLPVVNRNLVREAYWMEWANGVAGVELNWNTYRNGNGLTSEETALLATIDKLVQRK